MFEIGSSLRDARVRQGLELPQLEAETKIRAKYLRALEDEQFDLLPGEAYVKGFLRTYAERLGLDGQLYVDEFNSRFSLLEEPPFSAGPRRRSRQSRLESHAVLIALGGIIAVTVLVIAAWQLGATSSSAPEEPAPAPPAAPAEPPPPPPATVAEEDDEEEAAPPATGGVTLVVTAARGPSVAEVRRGSARGELLWEGTIEAGASQPFVARRQLWLKLRKPQNLDLELNGEPVEGTAAVGPSIIVVTADGVRLVESP